MSKLTKKVLPARQNGVWINKLANQTIMKVVKLLHRVKVKLLRMHLENPNTSLKIVISQNCKARAGGNKNFVPSKSILRKMF